LTTAETIATATYRQICSGVYLLASQSLCNERPTRHLVADRGPVVAEHTHANIEKATELTRYEPTRDIRDGVNEFISWYEQNRDWYEPLVLNS